MSFGIVVSRDGYDVNTATILQQEFNSQHNSLKIALEGLSTESAVNGSRNVQINHGLGIAPSFLCWMEVDSSGYWFPQYIYEKTSGKNCIVNASSTSTSLYLEIETGSSANIKVYYVLFYDPAT